MASNTHPARMPDGPAKWPGGASCTFCPLCHPYTALDQASSLSRKLAYVPGPTFGFVKLLASSGSHCTKWADEQHRQAGFESRLVPDLPLPFIPTLIGLRAFDLVSSRVWWEAATNTWCNGWQARLANVHEWVQVSLETLFYTALSYIEAKCFVKDQITI